LFESLQLRHRMLALAATFAQLLFGASRAFFRDDARVIGAAQLIFERLQLDGDAADARLNAAEVRLEIGELAFEGEDARRCAFGAPADDQRTAHDVAVERDERCARPLLRALDRFAKIADD